MSAQGPAAEPDYRRLRFEGVAAALALAAYWTVGYRRGRFSRAGELPETLLLAIALLAAPGQPPLPPFGITFRALYGPLWLSLLRFGAWGIAIGGAALAHGSFDLGDQFGKAAGLVLATFVMPMLRRTIGRLQHSELRLRALLEHSTDVVTIVDVTTRVLWQAASVRSVLGYDPDGMAGRPLAALVHPEERPAFRHALGEGAPAPGETATLSCHMRDASGAYRDIEAIVGNRRHEEHIGGLLLTLRDVTERRRRELEVRVQRSLRLESIGQLAGGVAHDFNNLLAVILNCAALLHDDLPAGDVAQEDVAEIRQAAVDRRRRRLRDGCRDRRPRDRAVLLHEAVRRGNRARARHRPRCRQRRGRAPTACSWTATCPRAPAARSTSRSRSRAATSRSWCRAP